MFRKPKESFERPKPLKRKPSANLYAKTVPLIDSIALVISIQRIVHPEADYCIFCSHGDNAMANCEKDFKDVHEEAD